MALLSPTEGPVKGRRDHFNTDLTPVIGTSHYGGTPF